MDETAAVDDGLTRARDGAPEDALETRLARRLHLFRESGQVRPEVVDFVTSELRTLADTGRPVSEETSGMLTSHLVMALNRLLDGAALDTFPAADHLAAELADHPGAVTLARGVADRAAGRLGARLPETEVSLLAAHLAVLEGRPRAE